MTEAQFLEELDGIFNKFEKCADQQGIPQTERESLFLQLADKVRSRTRPDDGDSTFGIDARLEPGAIIIGRQR